MLIIKSYRCFIYNNTSHTFYYYKKPTLSLYISILSYSYVSFFCVFHLVLFPRLNHLNEVNTMKLDIQQTITSGITNLFEAQSSLQFFMHKDSFDKFARMKESQEDLTFEDYLNQESTSNKGYSFGIKLLTDWQYQKQIDALVSVENNRINFSLIPLFIKEKQTDKLYRIGEKHILAPDNKVYAIRD